MNKENLLLQFDNYLKFNNNLSNTRRSKCTSLRLYLEWLEQQNLDYLFVTHQDIIAYINYCKSRGNIKHTINLKITGIQRFYELLEEQELVDNNPCEGIRLKGVMRRMPHNLLDKEQLDAVYNDFKAIGSTGKRDKAILSLIIFQGLGSGEIAKLKVEDIKLEEAKIYVPSVSRSNSRILELDAHQILLLQQYLLIVRPYILSLTNKKSEQLFISTGTGYKMNNVMARMMQVIRKTHPEVTGVKQLKASVITYWLSIHNIRQVQYLSGHRYVSSTERYRTDKLESLQEQLEQLHPVNSML